VPKPSKVGSQATSSLAPIVGNTAAGSAETPSRRDIHDAAAARNAGVPYVAG